MTGKNSDLKVSTAKNYEDMTRGGNIKFPPGGSGSRVDRVQRFPSGWHPKH